MRTPSKLTKGIIGKLPYRLKRLLVSRRASGAAVGRERGIRARIKRVLTRSPWRKEVADWGEGKAKIQKLISNGNLLEALDLADGYAEQFKAGEVGSILFKSAETLLKEADPDYEALLALLLKAYDYGESQVPSALLHLAQRYAVASGADRVDVVSFSLKCLNAAYDLGLPNAPHWRLQFVDQVISCTEYALGSAIDASTKTEYFTDLLDLFDRIKEDNDGLSLSLCRQIRSRFSNEVSSNICSETRLLELTLHLGDFESIQLIENNLETIGSSGDVDAQGFAERLKARLEHYQCWTSSRV